MDTILVAICGLGDPDGAKDPSRRIIKIQIK